MNCKTKKWKKQTKAINRNKISNQVEEQPETNPSCIKPT